MLSDQFHRMEPGLQQILPKHIVVLPIYTCFFIHPVEPLPEFRKRSNPMVL